MASILWEGCACSFPAVTLPLKFFPLFGLIGGLIAGGLVQIAPEISGSGIPQVRAALNRLKMTLNMKTALVKLVGGTIALGSVFFMGREGPTVQVGAAMAAQMTRWFPTTEEHRRQLIAAGAGAGLTAAFNAPIAGCIFVIEELLKEVKHSTVTLAIVACFSATLIEHVIGHPHRHLITAGASAAGVSFDLRETGFYILLGIICGFFGCVFNAGILLFLRLYRKVAKLPVSIRAGFAGLVTGLLVATLPPELHNYAEARTLINAGTLPPNLVPISFCAYMFLTLLAYGAGTPGGLFAPLLSMGSSLGYMVGYLSSTFTGHNAVQTFSLVGMAALFVGSARVPLTGIVIVFEMIGSFDLIAPLMISSVVANLIGEAIYKGPLYDLLMVWNGIHLHSPEGTKQSIARLKAADVLSHLYQFVPSGATMKQVFRVRDMTGQPGVPVVDDGKLIGIVTRSDIARIENPQACEDIAVSKMMTKNPLSVNPSDTLEDILFLFSRYQFNWLPVTRNDIYMGSITRRDVVQALFSETPDTPADVEKAVQVLQINKEAES